MKNLFFIPLLFVVSFCFCQKYDFRGTASSESDCELVENEYKSGHLEYGKYVIHLREIKGNRTEGELKINKEKHKLTKKFADSLINDEMKMTLYNAIDKNGVKKILSIITYKKNDAVDHYKIYFLDRETRKGKYYFAWAI